MNAIQKSASAMRQRIKKQEVVANNLSNASTPGYKKDMLFTKELSAAEKRQMSKNTIDPKPTVANVYTNFTPGVFEHTGNDLNVALNGDGFFQLQLADGTRALTRNGAFSINPDGLLEVPGGGLVIGDGGTIDVSGGDIEISETGIVTAGGNVAGNLTPVTVADLTQLEKVGGSLYILPADAQLISVDKTTVSQGYLEASNVDIVSEMIEMIVAYRNYEADAKSIQTFDQRLEHLFQRVGSKG